MKVIVTGSTGMIGKVVVKRLLEAGHSVRATDVGAQPLDERYEYIPGDIRDLNQVRRAIQTMEAVIHLAAIPNDFGAPEELVLDTNLRGTWNVLLAAQEAGLRRVVYVSSINALGQAEENHPGLYLPLDDDIPHYNVKNYSLSKHLGEEMCAAFAARGGFSAISLRPTLVTTPDPSNFPWWDMLSEDFKIQSYTGDFWSYVDVRDVAEAALLSLTAEIDGHRAFLLAADDNRTQGHLAEIIAKHYPHLPWPKISQDDYIAHNPYASLLDCSQAKQVLGWQPKYSLFDPASGYKR